MKKETFAKELGIIAETLLNQAATATGNENKPNYTDKDIFNITYIFQHSILDKLFDKLLEKGTSQEESIEIVINCGNELRAFIVKYTGLDTHKICK